MKSTELSATQVLAVRFYLTTVICIIINPVVSLATLTPTNLALVLAISFFCLIVPLYVSQRGIEEAGPEMNAIIGSTAPLITAIIEQGYYHNVTWQNFTVYVLYSFFAALPFAIRKFHHRKLAISFKRKN